MKSGQLKKMEIISNLSFVPVNRLDDVQRFIEYILYSAKAKKKSPISVRGIWENKGFEKINIEEELKIVRKEIQANLDGKAFD